jgi:hypothetical protein
MARMAWRDGDRHGMVCNADFTRPDNALLVEYIWSSSRATSALTGRTEMGGT